MYFDYTYLVFMLPAFIFALYAQIKVKSAFSKYSSVYSAKGITGAMAAQRVLSANGIHNVRIEHISGQLTDHYDPKTNVIRLSDGVYSSTSQAAIGVACHEAGHAVQHAVGYAPAKLRLAIVPITNIGSKLGMLLLPIGIILAAMGFYWCTAIAYIGLFGYIACAVFQLVTLPTEFNASSRAMEAIKSSGMLNENEQKGARKVLSAAALTYVAALFTSIMTILRFLVILSRISGRSRR